MLWHEGKIRTAEERTREVADEVDVIGVCNIAKVTIVLTVGRYTGLGKCKCLLVPAA